MTLLEGMEAKLKTGEYYGLGEFVLVHYAYEVKNTWESGDEIRLPVDSRFMRSVAALGATYRVPVVFHAEGEPEVVEQVERLLEASSGTRFIWAHNCGRISAEQIRTLLEKHSNLMCDLGGMGNSPKTEGGYGQYWPRRTTWMHQVQQGDGILVPEMKELFEAMPNRFVGIGTDTAHTAVLQQYLFRMSVFRVLLSQLSPLAAHKIGVENAIRVFGRSDLNAADGTVGDPRAPSRDR
jgi:hypothetical protein